MNLSEVESFDVFFEALWDPDSTRVRANIVDTILFRDGVPHKWLFTSDSGEVLKKKNNRLVPSDIVKTMKSRSKAIRGKKRYDLLEKIAIVWFFDFHRNIRSKLVDDLELQSILKTACFVDILAIQLYTGGYSMKGMGVFEHIVSFQTSGDYSHKTFELSSISAPNTYNHFSQVQYSPSSSSLSIHDKSVYRFAIIESQHVSIMKHAQQIMKVLENVVHSTIVHIVFQVVFDSTWTPFFMCINSLQVPPLPPAPSHHTHIYKYTHICTHTYGHTHHGQSIDTRIYSHMLTQTLSHSPIHMHMYTYLLQLVDIPAELFTPGFKHPFIIRHGDTHYFEMIRGQDALQSRKHELGESLEPVTAGENYSEFPTLRKKYTNERGFELFSRINVSRYGLVTRSLTASQERNCEQTEEEISRIHSSFMKSKPKRAPCGYLAQTESGVLRHDMYSTLVWGNKDNNIFAVASNKRPQSAKAPLSTGAWVAKHGVAAGGSRASSLLKLHSLPTGRSTSQSQVCHGDYCCLGRALPLILLDSQRRRTEENSLRSAMAKRNEFNCSPSNSPHNRNASPTILVKSSAKLGLDPTKIIEEKKKKKENDNDLLAEADCGKDAIERQAKVLERWLKLFRHFDYGKSFQVDHQISQKSLLLARAESRYISLDSESAAFRLFQTAQEETDSKRILELMARRHIIDVQLRCKESAFKIIFSSLRFDTHRVWDHIHSVYKKEVYASALENVHPSRFYTCMPVCEVYLKLFTVVSCTD